MAPRKRTLQIRLEGIGAALYDGIDGADALRQYFADACRGEKNGTLTISENTNGYAAGMMDDDFVEAVAVEESHDLERTG